MVLYHTMFSSNAQTYAANCKVIEIPISRDNFNRKKQGSLGTGETGAIHAAEKTSGKPMS